MNPDDTLAVLLQRAMKFIDEYAQPNTTTPIPKIIPLCRQRDRVADGENAVLIDPAGRGWGDSCNEPATHRTAASTPQYLCARHMWKAIDASSWRRMWKVFQTADGEDFDITTTVRYPRHYAALDLIDLHEELGDAL